MIATLHGAIVLALFGIGAIVAIASLAADVARLRVRWHPVRRQWPAAVRDRLSVAFWGFAGTAAFLGFWPMMRVALLP